MSYAEAVSYLDALGVDSMKAMAPSLHRMEAIVEALDHPQRAYPSLHITGTNGKTSCARIATSLLSAAGLAVGTFTSPHLEDVRERIALNGDPVSEETFGDVFTHLLPFLATVEERLGERLSYFEVLTAMFFLWAAEAPVDVAVVEVGLGGRWDATNVIVPPVGILTHVGLDHTAILGADKEAIAREKIGIAKHGSTIVTGERDPRILALLESEASGVGATVSRLPTDFDLERNDVAVGGRLLTVRSSDATYDDVFLPLHGRHQGVNAALAVEAVARFLPPGSLGDDLVRHGLGAAHVPGRLEPIPLGRNAPRVVLDVAHNPEGISALVSSLVESFAFEQATVVIGVLGDKDHLGMLTELTRLPCRVLCAEPETARALAADELARAAAGIGLDATSAGAVDRAVNVALDETPKDELVCVTGSHYVVGEARSLLAGRS